MASCMLAKRNKKFENFLESLKGQGQDELIETIHEGFIVCNEGLSKEDVGHIALDVVGLIPFVGEPADVANAIWYAVKGNYLMAALSLISVIPTIGDAVGKGSKAALYLQKAAKAGKSAQKLIKKNKTDIDKLFDKMSENEKVAPHIGGMRKALDSFVK